MINKNKNNIKKLNDFVIPAKAGIYKKIFSYTFLIIVSLFIFGDVGFAAEQSVVVSGTSMFIDGLNALLAGAGMIVGVLTGIVALLLNPGWVNGEIFGLTGPLKQMWIFMSNIVYFIFAGILIVIAFMNIVGKGGDKFELKQALPKFIVGILIVPLSWFIVQFILSISAVLTVSVLTIPFDTIAPTMDQSKFNTDIKGTCKNYIFNLQSSHSVDIHPDEKGTEAEKELLKNNKNNKPTFKCENDKEMIKIKDIIYGENKKTQSIYGLISLYSFGIMDLGSLDKFKEVDLKFIGKIFELGAKMVFDIAFILIYMILIIALFLALFVRGVWLWIYAMMSPLFGLMYFLGDKGGEALKKFTIKEFISLAMVPVLVSAALSFGMLFLFVAGEGLTSSSNTIINIKEQKLDLGFMTIKAEGSFGDANTKDNFIGIITNGAGGLIGYLIMKIFGLAIMWIAVMAALNSSKITGEIVKPIEEFGKKAGALAMSAPKFIPIPGTNGLTLGGVGAAGDRIMSRIQEIPNQKASTWAENKFPDLFGKDFSDIRKVLSDIRTAGTKENKFGKIREASLMKDPTIWANQPSLRKEFADALKEQGFDVTLVDSFRNASTDTAVLKALTDIQNASKNNPNLYGARDNGGIFGDFNIDTIDEVKAVMGKGGGGTGGKNNGDTNVNLNIDWKEYRTSTGKIITPQGETDDSVINALVSRLDSLKGVYDNKGIEQYLENTGGFTNEKVRGEIIKKLKSINGFIKDGNETSTPSAPPSPPNSQNPPTRS